MPSVFGAATYSTELMSVLEIVLVFVVIQGTKFHSQHGKIPDFAKAKKAIIGRFLGRIIFKIFCLKIGLDLLHLVTVSRESQSFFVEGRNSF